jgi:hypothetical protein
METTPARRRLVALALLGAVAARVASILLWPPDSDASHARMLATAAAHPLAWNLATWAEIVAWLLAAPAAFVVVGMVRGRGAGLTTVGGWFYGVSLLALGLTAGPLNAVTGVLAQQHHPAAMVAVIDDLHSSGSLLPFVAVLLLGEPMLVVFTAGLARARLVGWWFPALAFAGVAGYLVTSDSSDHAVVLAGFVPLAALWLTLAHLLVTGPAPAPQLPADLSEPESVIAD